jgi:hypothetical protein
VFDTLVQDDIFAATDALEALRQLEENTPAAILRQRASERLAIRAHVTIQPGNSSERGRVLIEGLTGDISNGGCQILLGRPILPGDVYWLVFAEEPLHIGALLARCLRCRMIREDTFEAGFKFFQSIDLADAAKSSSGSATE